MELRREREEAPCTIASSTPCEPVASISYPPAPWRLRGSAVLAVRLVDIAVARQFVPPQLHIVPVLPGKTLGVLYCAHYKPPSALRYHELIVAPALTWLRGKLGLWVSHIYVDNPAAMAAGREIWGLPKELARFHWCPQQGYLGVTQNGIPLCEISWRAGLVRFKTPLIVPALSQRESQWLSFRGLGSAKFKRCRATIKVNANSPFQALGFDKGRRLWRVKKLRLKIAAPKVRE